MKSITMLGLVVVALAVAACTPQTMTPEEDDQLDLEDFSPGMSLEPSRFATVEELNAFLSLQESGGGMAGYARGEMDLAVESATPKAAGDDGGRDYSETNVQVEGVDEGDIIKTDGEFLYTVSDDTLFLARAYPGEDAEVLSKVELEKGRPDGLFVRGDELVVFGRVSDYGSFEDLELPSSITMTFVDVYDVSDPSEPVLEDEFMLEGSYVESRMIDGYVYFVTQDYPSAGPRPLPVYVEGGSVKEVSPGSIRYYPMPYDRVSFVTVTGLSLDDRELSSETLTVEDSQTVYMSDENMYLAQTKTIDKWRIEQEVMIGVVAPMLSDSDKRVVERIRSVDSAVLSESEKRQKVLEIIHRYVRFLPEQEQDSLEEKVETEVKEELEQYDYFQYTVINRVSVDGLDLDVEANGMVPGSVVNQFALDEDDGVLRLATTVDHRWEPGYEGPETENFVFTLDEDLEELDRLTGLAPGERIYSARFMQERLYMVTFRQVDPFFVIDLSDAENIEELGELKITGFSRYLHPYGDDLVIGLGREATETGRQRGLKLSLFDVSDVSEPEEVAKWVSDERYSSSTAEYEHHAFLFSREKNLLVIPAYSHDYGDGEGYNGALVFDVSEDDIELRGLIDHGTASDARRGPAVERSLFIEDLLYTKSPSLLRINALEDLHSVKNVTLSSGEGGMPVY
ncbi:MAG: beta-propeller domain-containing protein [Candidatus Woesearchaeota archaeon]